MSLSLSSLLNPSPDADAQSSPPLPRKDSLPPIQYVQSPEQQFTTSPTFTHAHHHQGSFSRPPATEQDALHALAALAGSNAPAPVQPRWYSQNSGDQAYDRRSNSFEKRPGSSGMQLPPPPPAVDRKMSSPTLDQYHVASRSPEQRRQSMISPAQANFTLPPIQSFTGTQPDQTARPSSSHQHAITHAHPPSSSSHDDRSFTGGTSIAQTQLEHNIQHPAASVMAAQPAPAQFQVTTSNMSAASENAASSPADVKEEILATPRASSPVEAQSTPAKPSDGEAQSLKALASLKNEHGLRINSPLRESSVPMQSTEVATPEPTVPKKRPAPSRTKKGTATTTLKKAPPAKKRKVEPKRSVTPASQVSKAPKLKTISSKGTPANSSPVPSTRSRSAEPDDEQYEDEDMDEGPAGSDDELYCICRKPDNGTFMIGCDGTCDDWFHGKCVGIEERDKNLIDKYICPQCTKAGIGRTTWKRMCRRNGCRQAARIGKAKGGKDGSKYCSDECGVMYFREMVAHTRGREDAMKHRSNRRKSNIVGAERPHLDDDLGPRGGVISAGELKSLAITSQTANDFKKLGEGVLSPPATPDSKTAGFKKDHSHDYTESETKALQEISHHKDEARRKHQLLKDRMKFVTMVKQAGSRTATEKELKPKEHCGYDSRIEWTEEQFAAWRDSATGRQAFELETLAGGEDEMDTGGDLDYEVCDRKKCARHLEWAKLAVDDVRFEMSDNSDRMRALDKEEKEIRERAALRGKAGTLSGEGSVEVHGLGISVDAPDPPVEAMEVDAAA
ncbi:COMPASS (complex proteins associated with Set1p) component [Vermiconidia calcicola]|uniref:COMPASS (Complex proteins associated with Set1p) component n=1 Tax=Vermiconidia calcicola TaxID=1690605 RepID=A0ACC3NWL9_9PEZI|nr:COMPASS (complex proteins associated with Set1p) component [Vermiconidia calcicola]